ncbi:MAG: peptidylprolyl isomerase [Bacteroidota bacterium]
MKNKFFLILFFAANCFFVNAQDQIVDQVVGVVGSKSILLSDIENQYIQMGVGGEVNNFETKCQILEELMLQKMLLNQADLDSVVVTDEQVEGETERRLRYFISQIGSEKKLEEYFKKSIVEIKDELKESIRDQIMIDDVQKKISGDLKATPSEVKAYYNTIPKDSLPKVSAQVEVAQIVKSPIVTKESKVEARERLAEMRDRIIKGEDFAKIAILYSEDPGSAKKGGELGFYSRGELYPEFEAVAFALKDKELSDIIETKAGYHIIQMIERRGEQINVRHILIQAQVTTEAMLAAQALLDSVATLISTNKMTFEEAAQKYSDDDTKNNGGIILNQYAGTSKIDVDKVDPSLFFVVDKMRVGEISKPVISRTADGKQAYRIVKLNFRSDPHIANLKDDYQLIQDVALADKKARTMTEWVNKKKATTFVQINGSYLGCDFKYNWFKK